jgi:hypothetical protein
VVLSPTYHVGHTVVSTNLFIVAIVYEGVVVSFDLVEAFQFDMCCIMWKKGKSRIVALFVRLVSICCFQSILLVSPCLNLKTELKFSIPRSRLLKGVIMALLHLSKPNHKPACYTHACQYLKECVP